MPRSTDDRLDRLFAELQQQPEDAAANADAIRRLEQQFGCPPPDEAIALNVVLSLLGRQVRLLEAIYKETVAARRRQSPASTPEESGRDGSGSKNTVP